VISQIDTEKLKRHVKGVAASFVAVNLLISAVAYLKFPVFFEPGIMVKPQILATTIPLSIAFHLSTFYLEQVFDEQENNLPTYFRKVNTDSNN